jgi:methionyl-tRNA formyltransferase
MNWQIINGEPYLGISIIKVDEGMDTGPIAAQKKFKFSSNENINDANQKATHFFKEMLNYLLKSLERNALNLKKQGNLRAAYYCHRIEEEGKIRFSLMTAQKVHNLVRALTHPYPGAYAFLGGKKIIFVETEIPTEKIISTPGKIARKYKNGLLVACRDRCINLKKVISPPDKRIRFAKDAVPLGAFFDI